VNAASILPEIDRLGLARALERQLTGNVEIALSLPPHPHDEEGMGAARRAEALVGELAALSPKLRVVTGSAPSLADLADDAPPVITLTGAALGGVHFAGAPAGYEIPILVAAFIAVSRGETGLAPATVKVLAELRNPVAVRMMVSATCPTCGPEAMLAVQMAIASRHIDAWILDAAQVPRLAKRIGGTSLPSALINDICWAPGPQPELALLARVLFAGT
jgi:alkyl hydroperoxide reductase subunit AhpF